MKKIGEFERPEDIDVKITRAERRGKKIIIAIEPDLLTGEEFCPTPFYNEGHEKNKLEDCRFNIKVKEKDGYVEAEASYDGDHYTKGHSQIFFGRQYKDRKDAAIAWIFNTDKEYFTEDRAEQIKAQFFKDKEFMEYFERVYNKRKEIEHRENIEEARKEVKEAMEKLDKLITQDVNEE